jgi:hypothetical protein
LLYHENRTTGNFSHHDRPPARFHIPPVASLTRADFALTQAA